MMLKKLLLLLVSLVIFSFSSTEVSGQAVCSGSGYYCCTRQEYRCSPEGCTPGRNCSSCGNVCVSDKSGPCSHLQAEGGGCGVLNTNTEPPCISSLEVSCSASSTPTCPSGQVWCGAQGSCGAACRNISGYSGCQAWLNANCGGSGGGGGTNPTPPPACTPVCNRPLCGQSNGCGGTCGTNDGVPSLSTPNLHPNQPTAEATYNSPVRVGWTSVTNAHHYRVEVEEILGGGNRVAVTSDNINTTQTWLSLPGGYYRVRVRAAQQWRNYGQCPSSGWSAWRRFRVAGPTPTPTTPTATATPTPRPANTPTPTPVSNPTCTVTLNPSNPSVNIGSSVTLTAATTATNGNVSNVQFSVNNTAVASINPSQDSSSPYTVSVTGRAIGTATVTARVFINGTQRCSTTRNVTINNVPVVCGNGSCQSGETCSNCPADCGACATPSCTISMTPASFGVVTNQSTQIGASITASNGTVSQVQFSSSNTARATVTPGSDSSSPYTTSVRGVSNGAVTITARGFVNGVERCSTTRNVNVGSTAGPTPAPTSTPPTIVCGNGVCQAGETCNNCAADCGVCACIPVCTGPLCGQLDGCGGTCPNTDGQQPPAPNITGPADEALVVATGNDPKVIQLTMQRADTDPIRLELFPQGTNCSHSLARCLTISNSGSVGSTVTYSFQIPLASYGSINRFQWRVTHVNNTCGGNNTGYTAWREFTLADDIVGNILIDDGAAGLSGGSCVSPYSPRPYEPEGVEEIFARVGGNNYAGTLNTNGTYSIRVPVSNSGTYAVEFESNRESAECRCPGGCTYNNINSPRTSLNFYYQPVLIRDPWWQSINGHIYGGNRSPYAVVSEVPDTCFGICTPAVSLRNDADRADTTGVIISGGGAIDTSNEAGNQTTQIDEENKHRDPTGTTFGGVIENYAYFYRLYSMGDAPGSDIGATSDKPTQPPANGRAYFRNGDLTISNAWNVGASEEIVIFVDGNLNIQNNIQVAEGGFLAFIVSGNMTVGQDVCQSNHESTEAVVEGVFVADGTFLVASRGNADCKFVGEGIFVAWSNISLPRDYRTGLFDPQDGWNAYYPVDVFRYRPDFVVNLPERMQRPLYLWQEVAP